MSLSRKLGRSPRRQSRPHQLPDRRVRVPNLVNKGNIFFYDEDENFLAKDGVDFLQRAIRSYLDTQKYTSDDSNELPALTDLSMLVQYKVVKALPSPPPGQKFVLDPQSRKVSLVSN
jgi:hypothetical protein